MLIALGAVCTGFSLITFIGAVMNSYYGNQQGSIMREATSVLWLIAALLCFK